jgi:hypothetical protein
MTFSLGMGVSAQRREWVRAYFAEWFGTNNHVGFDRILLPVGRAYASSVFEPLHRQQAPSFLAQRSRQLVVQRPRQGREDGTWARLNEAFDRHSGDELEGIDVGISAL